MGDFEGRILYQMILQEHRTERYTCNICKQTFERVFPRCIMCMVIHPPGTCCHYGDTVITKRQLQKEREVQQAVEQEKKENEQRSDNC